jgi:hypothetical protein
MKTIFKTSVLAVLLLTPGLCFGLMGLKPVSKEQAKELGLELRFLGSGTNGFWVELEFKTEGKLKDFDCVDLEIAEGEKLLLGWAPLRERRSDSGSVVVRFLADRAYLDKIILRAVTGPAMMQTGYDLRLKDFIEPEKVR